MLELPDRFRRLVEAIYRGEKAILISAVAEGSEAFAQGLRPGQRILSVSDPIRNTEMWEVDGRTSLRYVRDALKMRRAPTLNLVVEAIDLDQVIFEDGADVEYAPGDEPRDAEGNIIRPARPLTPLERRIKKRQERYEIEAQRNDAPYLALVGSLFFVPALVILGVAYSTGYLDRLAANL